jgi:predicted  nucleic acid-binding Zn-ribbon protein
LITISINGVTITINDDATLAAIADLKATLIRQSEKEEEHFMDINEAIAAMQAEVEANTDATQSADLLLDRLGDLIQQSINAPAKLQELATRLKTDREGLVAATLRNTPAEPQPTPAP